MACGQPAVNCFRSPDTWSYTTTPFPGEAVEERHTAAGQASPAVRQAPAAVRQAPVPAVRRAPAAVRQGAAIAAVRQEEAPLATRQEAGVLPRGEWR
jgi:hypothetical protein